MNWQNIKDKYPKAAKEFVRCYGEPVLHVDGTLMCVTNDFGELVFWNDRTLYDLFDHHSIHIWVAYDYEISGQWFAYIAMWRELLWTESSDEREERESAAFEKAFEILEQQLT